MTNEDMTEAAMPRNASIRFAVAVALAIGIAVAAAAIDARAESGAAPDGLISDFEDDGIVSRYGHGWEASTDARMGGRSTATLRRIEDGANGSRGALEISGELKSGFLFRWAGATFFPGSRPMQPVAYPRDSELVFRARGDGREYRALLLSGRPRFGAPPSRSFVAGPQWTEVRLPLKDFRGADPARMTGIGFSAGGSKGPYHLAIDDVRVRPAR